MTRTENLAECRLAKLEEENSLMWQACIAVAVVVAVMGPAKYSEHPKGMQEGSGALRDVRRSGAAAPDRPEGITREKLGNLPFRRD